MNSMVQQPLGRSRNFGAGKNVGDIKMRSMKIVKEIGGFRV